MTTEGHNELAHGERLKTFLTQAGALRAAHKNDLNHADFLRLKDWQSGRLAQTYKDLRADERYSPATEFFLADLYGSKDFSLRDAEAVRVMPILTSMLPARALATLSDALRLDALSESLDTDMVAALREMGCAKRIDEQSYAAAYRRCGRPADRQTQISLMEEIGITLDRLTRMPMLHGLLRLMRGPAELAGFSNLQSFLERGFTSFKHMGGSAEFLSTILRRETEFMQNILSGHELR